MVGRKESEPVSVYQLKVTLEDIEPPIWRRILVKGDVTLSKLHRIIQLAMGWEDYHLHEFMVGEECYAIPSPEDPWPMEMKNEKRAKLLQRGPASFMSTIWVIVGAMTYWWRRYFSQKKISRIPSVWMAGGQLHQRTAAEQADMMNLWR